MECEDYWKELHRVKQGLDVLENISSDTLKINVVFKVTSAFEVNLFFKDDKEKVVFIEEYLRKKLFNLYYPCSLVVSDFCVVKSEYGLDELNINFLLSTRDYVMNLVRVFKFYSMSYVSED